MHVTLSFLGHVHEARLDVIQQALATIRAPRMKPALEGFGTFDRAGVLYAAVKKSPALLSRSPNTSRPRWKPSASPAKDRPYSPTSPSPAAAIASACALMQTTPLSAAAFEASEFRLYQSFTLPEGPRYDVLRAFPRLIRPARYP